VSVANEPPGASSSHEPVAGDLLVLDRIGKRFGKTLALDDVSLRVRAGTVHALLGENGAGKTTLMRAAFGSIEVDSGTISIAGVSTPIRSPADAIAGGIGMVHQHFTNVPAMSVAENVALGGRGRFDRATARARVLAIGERTGLMLDPDARAGDLPVGAQQRLEIVKALARHARLLILDEPTAVLAPAEANDLLNWLREFARAGNAVVLITHKLGEALAIADDVTVLRHGRIALNSRADRVTTPSLASAMLGAEPATERGSDIATPGAVVARIRDVELLSTRGSLALTNASLAIRAGEIVGVAAVEGAGQRELLRALAGRLPAALGTITLPSAIGFVPEDRHRDALVLEFSASENVALKGASAARGTMRWRAIRDRTTQLIREFDVRGGGPGAPVRALSGGNQQKLVLARELDKGPALLVVENPTRGLDIRAALEVRERLRDAATAGTAVVVYSGDLDEVLALATRVVVLYAGTLREMVGARDVETVGRAMLGVP
jgi:ABC-type uncharacterized transport system ATPase subunit